MMILCRFALLLACQLFFCRQFLIANDIFLSVAIDHEVLTLNEYEQFLQGCDSLLSFEKLDSLSYSLFSESNNLHIELDSLLLANTDNIDIKIKANARLLLSCQRTGLCAYSSHLNVLTTIQENYKLKNTNTLIILKALASFYINIGDLVKSWSLVEQGTILSKDLENDMYYAKFIQNQAVILDLAGLWKVALDKIKEFEKLVLETEAYDELPFVYYGYSLFYFNLNMPDSSFWAVNEFYKNVPDSINIRYEGFINYRKGLVLLQRGDLSLARLAFSDGILLSERRKEYNEVGLNYAGLSKVLLEQNKLDSARIYMDLALEHIVGYQRDDEIFKMRYDLYSALNSEEDLIALYAEQIQHEKDIYKEESKELLISNLSEIHYNEQKRLREELKNEKKASQRFVIVFVCIMIAMALLYVNQRRIVVESNLKKVEKQKKHTDALNNELDLLNTVLLHDINSPMISLEYILSRDFALLEVEGIAQARHIVNEVKSITQYVHSFRTFDASDLSASFKESMISIANSICIIYAEKDAFIELNIDIKKDYSFRTSFYCSVIFRNILDNIFKHCSSDRIVCNISENLNTLEFTISCSGDPMRKEVIDMYIHCKKHSQYRRNGLRIIHGFLDRLNGSIDVKYKYPNNIFIVKFPLRGNIITN